MIMLFNGDLYSLLNFLSFARWLFIGLVVAGLIYLRYKRPDMPRPFKVTSALYSFTWILPPLLPVARQQGSIFWCNKLTSFSGRAELRENSVLQWRLRVIRQGPQCYPGRVPFCKTILASSLCLRGRDWSCCAEMKAFAQFSLPVVFRLCDVSCVKIPWALCSHRGFRLQILGLHVPTWFSASPPFNVSFDKGLDNITTKKSCQAQEFMRESIYVIAYPILNMPAFCANKWLVWLL